MGTVQNLKKEYKDLKGGIIHPAGCFCTSCLFHFYKMRNKKTRIDRDNFFLYRRAHDLNYDWKKILPMYYEITGHKWRKSQFEKPYPGRPEQYRIVSRYKKKANISSLIKIKDGEEALLPIHAAPFMLEAGRFLKSINKYDDDCPTEIRLLSDVGLGSIHEMIVLAARIFFFIVIKEQKEKRMIKHIDILRRFKILGKVLPIFLDYLQQKKLIIWAPKQKMITLHLNWGDSACFFFDTLDRLHEGLEKFSSRTIRT